MAYSDSRFPLWPKCVKCNTKFSSQNEPCVWCPGCKTADCKSCPKSGSCATCKWCLNSTRYCSLDEDKIRVVKFFESLEPHSPSFVCSACGVSELEERGHVCLECAAAKGASFDPRSEEFNFGNLDNIALCCYCVLENHSTAGHTRDRFSVYKFRNGCTERNNWIKEVADKFNTVCLVLQEIEDVAEELMQFSSRLHNDGCRNSQELSEAFKMISEQSTSDCKKLLAVGQSLRSAGTTSNPKVLKFAKDIENFSTNSIDLSATMCSMNHTDPNEPSAKRERPSAVELSICLSNSSSDREIVCIQDIQVGIFAISQPHYAVVEPKGMSDITIFVGSHLPVSHLTARHMPLPVQFDSSQLDREFDKALSFGHMISKIYINGVEESSVNRKKKKK